MEPSEGLAFVDVVSVVSAIFRTPLPSQPSNDKIIPDPTPILLKSSDGNDASSTWVAEDREVEYCLPAVTARAVDAARAQCEEETSTLSKAGHAAARVPLHHLQGGARRSDEQDRPHAATGPVPIPIKAGDEHDEDRAATSAMAETTAEAGDPNMAESEDGNTRTTLPPGADDDARPPTTFKYAEGTCGMRLKMKLEFESAAKKGTSWVVCSGESKGRSGRGGG